MKSRIFASYHYTHCIMIATFVLIISSCTEDHTIQDKITYTPVLDSIHARIISPADLKSPTRQILSDPSVSYSTNPKRYDRIKPILRNITSEKFSFSLINKIVLDPSSAQYPIAIENASKPMLAGIPNRTKLKTDRYQENEDLLILDENCGVQVNHSTGLFQDNEGAIWGCSRWGASWKFDGTHFYNYKEETGLPDYSVVNMLFDSAGDTWFGMSVGLVKYDGHSFTNYSDNNQISNLKPTKLVEDNEGNIWVGSQEGLYRIDRETDNIEHFDSRSGLMKDEVNGLFYDSKGNLWVLYNNLGISILTAKSEGGKRTYNLTNYESANEGVFQNVQYLYEDKNGQVFIGNSDGIISVRDGQLESNNDITALKYRIENEGNFYYSIVSDQNENIYVATDSGLFQLVKDANENVIMASKDINNKIIPTGRVFALLVDKQNYLWASSGGKVIKRINLNNPVDNISANYGLSLNVLSMAEDQWGNFWINTKNKTLYCLKNPGDPELEYLLSYTDIIESNIPYNSILLKDINQNIWTFEENRLIKIELLNEGSKIKRSSYDLEGQVEISKIESIYADSDGSIWVADNTLDFNDKILKSKGGGVYKVDKNEISIFRQEQGLLKNDTYRITQDNEGNYWFISLFYGLTKYEPQSNNGQGRWIHFEDKKLKNGFSIIPNHTGGIHIRSAKGLYAMPSQIDTPYQKSYRYSQAKSGLSSNVIRSIINDDVNNIWISHPSGFDRIQFDASNRSNATVKIDYYNKSEGFYKNALLSARRNNLYYNTDTDFYSMDIKRMTKEYESNNVIINRINLLNQDSDWHADDNGLSVIDQLQKKEELLRLDYTNNYLEIEYNAIEVNRPHKLEYRYFLDGYEHGWNRSTKSTTANYPNLPHGNYEFKVQARIIPSDWSDKTTSYNFSISPPWWHTWWAYIIYLIGSIALLFALFKYLQDQKIAKVEALRLKELDTLKTQLYTNITHEFRTPLTIITGMTSQIKEDPEQWLETGVEMIQRNSVRLLGLVNQMLDLSKLESGKITLKNEQRDIIIYLQYLVDSVQSLAESKGLVVHFYTEEKELIVDFDPEKIQQIITNLLSNAIKFTPSGGHIYMLVRQVEGKDKKPYIQIKVKDTGIGIPEDQLHSIFDRFHQVDDSTTRSGEGSGIGLALIKELLLIMNGEISVTSQIGIETEFKILLPITRAAIIVNSKLIDSQHEEQELETIIKKQETKFDTHHSILKTTDITHRATKPQLLIIEDNPDIVAYIASCLDHLYAIKVGINGQEGLEIANDIIPDLIITDVMMPIMDGFEVSEKLKSNHQTSHIPIIMLTAKIDMESRLEGLNLGVDAYLSKPFHKEELLIRIKSLLETRKKLQEYYLSLSIGTGNLELKTPNTNNLENDFIIKLRKVLEDNYENPELSIDKLSMLMVMSQSSLSRKLSALTGMTPVKYIRYIRISKAKKLLLENEDTISMVALNVGFDNAGYFGRVFKKEFGMTPREWRETNKK